MAIQTPSLESLIASLPQQLGNQILTPEQSTAQVESLVNASLPEALRGYRDSAQNVAENAFGRGMGLSTWNAYQQALQGLLQSEGVGKIRQNAQTAVDQAQQAAIGNAASYATSGQNRAAQEASQRRLISAQGKLLNQNQIYQGLGGLAGGVTGMLGREFQPEIKKGLTSGYEKLIGPRVPNSNAPKTPGVEQIGSLLPTLSGEMAPPNTSSAGFIPSYGTDQGFSLRGLGDSQPTSGFSFGDYSSSFPSLPDLSLESLINSSADLNWGDLFSYRD